MDACTWPLGNNQTLEFNIYDPSTTRWNSVAGLYIFARRTDAYRWAALYVGQTDDFRTRIPYHERWNSALQRGATHVHCVVVPLAANRDTLERRLIAQLQPPMNEQLRYARMRSSAF